MPGGTLTDLRGRALERRGRPRPAQPQRPRRPDRLRHLPGRARPRVVGAALPDLRRGPAVGPPGLRVHRLGRRSPRRWRLARVAARQRLARARCCGAGPARTARRRAPSGRCATSCRWCASTSASPLREGGAPRARDSCWRSRPARPPRACTSPARYDVPPPGWELAPRDVMAGVAARAGGAPRPPRPRAAPTAASTTRARRSAAGRSRSSRRRGRTTGARGRSSQTVVDDRSGRVLESWTGYKVEWTMARGYAGAFGRVANALWVWLPLCALFVLPFARPPWRLLHLDLAVLLAFSVSYAFFNASRDRRLGPARLSAARLPAGAHARHRLLAGARPRAPAAAADRPGRRARDRGGLHPRLPHRAQRHRLERDRRRLRERDRRRPLRRRRAGLRRVPARQPARRHLRPGPLLRLRPVRGAAAVERRLGRPARRPRRRGRVRPAHRGGAVAARPAPARAGPRRAARLRVGDVPVHAAGGELERQRRPRRAARDRRDARARAAGRARRGVGGGRADEVRPDRAGAAVRDLRRRPRGRASLTAAGFALVAALALAPVALGDGLGTFYDRTLGFQADRGSPFSVWGLYDLPGRTARPRRRARARRGRRLRPAPPRSGQPSPRSAPRR